MKCEWEKCKLGDVCNISSSKRIFAKEYTKAGIPFYRGKEIIEKSLGNNVSTELFISQKRYEEIKSKFDVPQKGDILLTSVGTLGVPWLVNEDDFYFKDGNLTWLRTKNELLNTFLYLWLNSSEAKHQIDTMCIGSTQRALTIDTLRKFEISVPSIQTQEKICSILYPIMDKIELNNAINNNLEQQAQALFKQWFIDNPENTNWSVGTFSELIQSTLNGDWGKETPTGNNAEKVYCIRGADIPEVKAGNKGKMPIRYILPKNYTNKKLEAGDIVVEISGGSPTQSTGRCTAITQSLLDRYDSGMVCTNFCKAIKPKSGYSLFVYYYWQYLYEKGIFFSYENGTTGIKNLDFSGLIETESILIPPFDKIIAFDDYCKSIFNQIFANGKESEHLVVLRDTLLPKLMSGEIDVSDIEL